MEIGATKIHGKKSIGGINRMVMDAHYFAKKPEKEAKVIKFSSIYVCSNIKIVY